MRADILTMGEQQKAAERARATLAQNWNLPKADVSAEKAGSAEAENHIATAEAELVKSQAEKSDLLAKLQANEAQIAELQKRLEQMSKTPPNPNPGAPSVAELQAQLEEARKQIDAAEEEKSLLAAKMQPARSLPREPEPAAKRHEPVFRGSIRGTILAVNHAYNFVVLNLGGRQGVEANAEMVILRGGAPIGKIRISSVEPATAIGDIVTNSLERGVQVQPGDTVVYAGSNS